MKCPHCLSELEELKVTLVHVMTVSTYEVARGQATYRRPLALNAKQVKEMDVQKIECPMCEGDLTDNEDII